MYVLRKSAILLLAAWVMVPGGAAHAEEGGTTVSALETYWTTAYQAVTGAIQTSGVQKPDYEWKKYDWRVLAKAGPDECYYGIGDARNVPSFYANYPEDFTADEIAACLVDGGHPKVNQAYVWSLTKYHGRIWAGTLANTHCLVMGSFYGPDSPFPPVENDSWVCEMDAQLNGDYRPPRIFVYDTVSHAYTDLTALVLTQSETDRQRLMSTIGLRSAGNLNGVVFLGGIGFGGVNLFAFDAVTMAYLGSQTYPQYDNIRQWQSIEGQLYTGVGKAGGGEVLRWTGDLANPFSFETVGNLLGDPAYIHWHAGRIYASTWGGPPGSGGVVLYMSPLKGDDRMLTAADAGGWQIVWRLSDYEVEPAAVQGGGALKSFDGYLYWGTMCVPGTGVYAFSRIYEDAPIGIDTHLGTYRPIAIFRGKNFGEPTQKVEVLYGSKLLPKYDPVAGAWNLVPNNMNQAPRYGLAGINNYFNNYTWWMEVFDDNLFVGTMDHLYLIAGALSGVTPVPENTLSVATRTPPSLLDLANHFYGADLWRFPRGDRKAIPVSISGVGNYSNYGVRTMVLGGDHLYLGMANPMNLLTDPNDDKPEGGWELIKLWKRPDKDHDGIPDEFDDCPAYANDDIGEPCCDDEDADGTLDRMDACPFDPDDGIGDPCNHDEDGDGLLDTMDVCPFDAVHSAGEDPCSHDEDGDGVPDDADACPLDPNDAIGDPCDHDEDGDGVADALDACPFDPDDDVGDPCNHDDDGDGVEDGLDECPLDPNDGFNDPCNHDEDGDGLADDADTCPDVAASTSDGCPAPEPQTPQPPPQLDDPAADAPVGCSTTGSSSGAIHGLLLAGLALAVRRRKR